MITMKNIGYLLIILSWILLLSGIMIELVMPYNNIISEPAEEQPKLVRLSLGELYWYFIPAAVTGFTGGLIIHRHKMNKKRILDWR